MIRAAVLALLIWAGVSDAQAAVNYPTQQQAYSGCMAHGSAAIAPSTVNKTGSKCTHTPSVKRYNCRLTGTFKSNGNAYEGACSASDPNVQSDHYYTTPCPGGSEIDPATAQCVQKTCNEMLATPVFPELEGSAMCTMSDLGNGASSGCSFRAVYVPNGTESEFPGSLGGYVNLIADGGTCDPETFECGEDEIPGTYQGALTCTPKPECPNNGPRDPQTDSCIPPKTCPTGQHKDESGACVPDGDTCPYGQIKGPDGSCVTDNTDNCPAGQAKGSDGSCKPDADNDGEPDTDEDTGTFSGGEDCNVPPACSGDNIMCGQARIQWRIDCNTRKNAEISGGSCDAMPVCTGDGCDQRQHKQLIMEWRVACATEKLLLKSQTSTGSGTCVAGQNPGDQNCNAQPDWTENPGDGTNQDLGPGGSPDAVVVEGDAIGASGLDVAGLGFPETCPTIPTVNVMGTSITFDTSVFCNWLELGGQFVLIAAALLSLRILGSGGSV